jgi:hypothetical protein
MPYGSIQNSILPRHFRVSGFYFVSTTAPSQGKGEEMSIDTQPYQIVDSAVSRLAIAEDTETRQLHLVRGMGAPTSPIEDQTIQAIGLYRVTHPDGRKQYVLAESQEGAILQSTAGLHGNYAKHAKIHDQAIAERVPFRIRGWSDAEF